MTGDGLPKIVFFVPKSTALKGATGRGDSDKWPCPTVGAIGYLRSSKVLRSTVAGLFLGFPLDEERYAASASSFEFSKGK